MHNNARNSIFQSLFKSGRRWTEFALLCRPMMIIWSTPWHFNLWSACSKPPNAGLFGPHGSRLSVGTLVWNVKYIFVKLTKEILDKISALRKTNLPTYRSEFIVWKSVAHIFVTMWQFCKHHLSWSTRNCRDKVEFWIEKPYVNTSVPHVSRMIPTKLNETDPH